MCCGEARLCTSQRHIIYNTFVLLVVIVLRFWSGVEPVDVAGRSEEEQGLRGVPVEALPRGVRSEGQRLLQGGAEKIRLLSSGVSIRCMPDLIISLLVIALVGPRYSDLEAKSAV